MIATAISRASPSWPNASDWSALTPPMLASTPAGRSSPSTAAVTEAVAAPRSSPSGSTEMVTFASPSSRVTEAGTSTCSTRAMSVSRTGPDAVVSTRWRSAATSAGVSVGTRSTCWGTPARVTVPTGVGCSAPASSWPTDASVRPTRAAAARSTRTCTVGWSAARLLVTSATPSVPRSTSATRSEAACSCPASALVTMTSMVVAPKPAAPAVTVTSPASSPRPSRRERTSSASRVWSASASVVTAKLAAPPPPVNAAALPSAAPTVVCTLSTPSTSPSTRSTWRAAASLAARLAPGGSCWLTVRVFCPVSPRKFVGTSGTSATVPTRITAAAPIVRQGWARVARSTGRYPRWSRPRPSFSSAAARTCSRSTCSRGPRSNHDARTGTIVSETTREASSAMVTVSANGRNSSPTWPPTSAMGRKTATVVRVEAVTAPATSRTAVRIAGSLSSP